MDRYEYIKNHKKTVKNEQARTREPEEYKAEAKKNQRNDATKKTQKALLKQQYENFNATSSESLDSIFTQAIKSCSRLAVLLCRDSSEDLNAKFLRSYLLNGMNTVVSG
ncbi:hypothetical protein Tco_0967245 [Tanacetum coccineum]